MAEKLQLNNSLQENVLTILCHNDQQGKVVVNIVKADLFEGDYRLIAEKAIEFWRKYGCAPKDHTIDLIGDILEGNANTRRADLFRNIEASMRRLAPNINFTYVMSQLTNFVRMQRLKAAIIESAEKLNKDEEMAIRDIEGIWADMLRAQEIGFDAGVRLTAIDTVLDYLDQRMSEFAMGIGVLDKRGAVPARGELATLLGSTGDGKTWHLVNCGKHALRRGKKVVHLSLEFAAELVVQRYFQSFFSITTRETEKLNLTGFKSDGNGRIREFRTYAVEPEFSFASSDIKTELETRIEIMGAMAENLIVKRFPPNRITDKDVRAYLDNLEQVEKFIPDMLIIDCPQLYKFDTKNPTVSIGQNIVDTRATCIERNVAGVIVHQINRTGAREASRDMTHIGMDWSVNQTCDLVAVLSKTKAEAQLGLARILVDKARNVKDKFEVLITQSYDIGQFCIDSMIMNSGNRKLLTDFTKEENEDEEEDKE